MPTPPAPDFDALLQGVPQVGGASAKLPKLLDKLPADQQAKVRAALANTDISAARIAKALTKFGPDFACSQSAVSTWRRHHGIT